MSAQSVSLNTPVNARVRKLVMEMDAAPSLRTSNSQMTDMYGSGRVEKYVASGNSGSYPSASAGDYQSVSGVPERLVDVSVGGRQNKVRKQGVAKALRTFGRAVKPLGKNLKPIKDALVEEIVDEIEYGGRQNKVRKQGAAKALRTYGRAVKPLGKTIKPIKDALVDAAVSNIKGLGIGSAVKSFFGGAKPKMAKGSPEMKAHMARLRAMRKK